MDVTMNYAKFVARFNRVLLYASMIALVGFTALPIIYMVSTAFKPLDELFLYPPTSSSRSRRFAASSTC